MISTKVKQIAVSLNIYDSLKKFCGQKLALTQKKSRLFELSQDFLLIIYGQCFYANSSRSLRKCLICTDFLISKHQR